MSTFRQKVQANTDWGTPDPADEVLQRREQTGRRQSANRRSATRAQITGHRLFPAFVALWFAALFGLGSLAISSQVLGALVTAIGLPALVPAAAPPLGFTAHLLVALLLTIVGGGLGLVLGLRLRPHMAAVPRPVAVAPAASEAADGGVPKVRARDAHPDAPPRRPLVLTEAFADPADSAIEEYATEEAGIEESGIHEPMVSADPLLRSKPGQAAHDILASEPETWIPVYTPGGEAALPPLDLAALDEAEEIPPFGPRTTPLFDGAGPLESVAEVHAEPSPEAEPAPDFGPASDYSSEPAEIPAAVPPTLLAATPQIPSGAAISLPSREQILAGEPWSPVASAPLDSLGLVQLIERLALAIAARKAASHAGPPPPSDGPSFELPLELPKTEAAPFASPAPHAASSDDSASEVPASEEPLGSAREAIMRRLGAVAAHAAPAEPTPAPFSRAMQAPALADAVVPMRQADLLARPFAAPSSPTAIPAPTTVHTTVHITGPTTGPITGPGPFETDEALRSALATLQRMSARG